MSKPKLLLLILSHFFLTGCQLSDPGKELHTLFDEAWDYQLKEDPLFATSVGVHSHNDRLPSVSMEDLKKQAEYWQDLMNRIKSIKRAKLKQTDQINYDIFKRQVWDRIENFKFKSYLIPFTSESGFHTQFAQLPSMVPLNTVRDYENYIKRLEAFPVYLDQHIALLKEGVAIGMTLPGEVLEGFDQPIAAHVVTDASKSVFFSPFKKFPQIIPPNEQERLQQWGRTAIMTAVAPAYKRLLDYIVKEYIPNARPTIGASELPNGPAYYNQRVKYYTTLDLSVDEIHRLGVSEVKRIRAEMDAIIQQVGFKGDFAAFLKFLRTSPRFYAKTADELLKEASFIAKQMDAKLPSLFKTLPRLPYGVAAVPDHIAPKYTVGRYVEPAYGSNEPGYYWVNTYALDRRPLYTLEALTFHEAVPGHHLQGALAAELENLPNFRRFSYISAYGEGWGLYCEWLGKEAGFYKDPYSDFGRLTYEMWRACRLVVDTGIHAKGWNRQQAMDFLASNTALSLLNVQTETDRYISWPGQALSYKIGELKIKELRKTAQKALGEKFDVREFHDVILRSGSVPLKTLELLVMDYIGKQ